LSPPALLNPKLLRDVLPLFVLAVVDGEVSPAVAAAPGATLSA
jgi:hypothetical protein